MQKGRLEPGADWAGLAVGILTALAFQISLGSAPPIDGGAGISGWTFQDVLSPTPRSGRTPHRCPMTPFPGPIAAIRLATSVPSAWGVWVGGGRCG